jgi:hypothetical protein
MLAKAIGLPDSVDEFVLMWRVDRVFAEPYVMSVAVRGGGTRSVSPQRRP